MGVPGADDVMLDYQSTSFHDALFLREAAGPAAAPEFEAWLERMRHHRRRAAALRPRARRAAPLRRLLGLRSPCGVDRGRTTPERATPGRRCAARPRRASRSAAPAPACRPARCCASAGPCAGARRGAAPLDARLRSSAARGRRLGRCRRRAAAPRRAAYLRRPDLGRRLDAGERRPARAPAAAVPRRTRLVVADGLSSLAPCASTRPPLLAALAAAAAARAGASAPVVIATQARVALGDEIGGALGARLVVMLIGERPGLSSPDSLGRT